MVTLRKTGEDVIEHSIFGVWKTPGVSQQLICAGNRSNFLFNEELSAVELPSPDIVSLLFLNSKDQLNVSGCDISQYYNRLAAPVELIPFLGMPKIHAKQLGLPHLSGFITPCLTCIAMGATFSVALAQSVTVAVL